MTYPPGSGPYGYGPQQPHDAGWGRDPNQPGAGWDAQPGGWEVPGWDQQPAEPTWPQPGYGGGYPPPPPPKNNSGLIVGIVFGVIALLVIGAGIVVVATRDSDGENRADATGTPALVPATTSAAPSPTTAAPGTRSGTAGHLSYQEYGHDWNFELGEVKLHADWVEGRDHPSCSDFEVGGKLTALGCEYAAEMVYRAEGGSLMLTQFVIGMSSADKAAAAPGAYTDADLKLRHGTYVDNFAVGKWKDDAQKEFLVVTFATATSSVDEKTAEKYLKYRHGDILGALAFR
ncbi:hypothetical protein [Nocardia veterana]|uniref:Uncharacterized protein n=1 Tax=Nocardia veterana TaxID=132249 RepID=A0A7X6LWB5_9NOCA|nr:hypothetical protein [Nocardia veterana]NKY85120.1 hypothetical protein [Nocardia veterana]